MGKKILSGLVLVLFVVAPLELFAATSPLSEPSKAYSATARILVQEDAPQVIPVDSGSTNYPVYNPYFMRTQIEILRSKPILNEVANRLNLATKWAKDGKDLSPDDTYEILRMSIDFKNNTNTSIIAIIVKRPDPIESAIIANAIAATFRDSRLDQLHENNRRIVEAYRKGMEEQKARVDIAEEAVDKLLVELDLPVYSEMISEVQSNSLVQIKADRLAIQETMLGKECLLKLMASLEKKDLLERAGFISQFDKSVVNVVQQIQDIESQLKSLGKAYGPNHPEVKRYRSQKDALEKVLEERVAAQKLRLETEYKMAKDKFASLTVLLFGITNSTGYFGEEYQPLRLALDRWASEQSIYKVLDAKIKVELASLDTEPRSPVEIISVAEPNP